jgi:4-carboxymuconolactone decarboxylase
MATDLNLGRFSEIDREEMTPQQLAAQKLLLEGARGSVPPPYRIWLSSPELVSKLEGLGQYLLRGTSLTPRETEIGILCIARHLACEFVVAAHARAGARVGLEPHVIEALTTGEPPRLSSAREQAVYDVSRALPGGPPGDELYRRALDLLGQHGIADLTGLLGYYTSVAFILNFHDVPKPNWA